MFSSLKSGIARVRKSTARSVAVVSAVVTSLMLSAELAVGQVTAPVSQGIVAGLGDGATAGSETGIFEIQSAIIAGLAVVLTIVLVVAGFRIVVRMVRKVSMTM